MTGAEYFASLASDVVDIAGDYLRSGVRVSVKTNYGPELPIFSGSAEGGSGSSGGGRGGFGLGKLIGFKAAVIVRNRDGHVIATYGGTPPATEPVRLVGLLVVLGAIGFVLVRGVWPR